MAFISCFLRAYKYLFLYSWISINEGTVAIFIFFILKSKVSPNQVIIIKFQEVKEKSEDTNDPTEIEDEFTAASDSQSVNSQDNSENNKDTNSESSQSENDETLIKDNKSKALEENNTEAANNSTDMKDNEATDNNTDKDDNKERTSNESSSEMEVDTINDTQDKIETPTQGLQF